jgi:hypothetical protein
MRSTTSALCPHIRRNHVQPQDGDWIMDCDCGWRGKASAELPRDEASADLERQFIAHLRPEELRAYILCDVRRPEGWQTVADIIDAAARTERVALTVQEAQRRFHAQPQIVGNFVMPEALPVELVSSRYEDEVHFGTFRIDGGDELHELPIGEVRTPEGRVFRAE